MGYPHNGGAQLAESEILGLSNGVSTRIFLDPNPFS